MGWACPWLTWWSRLPWFGDDVCIGCRWTCDGCWREPFEALEKSLWWWIVIELDGGGLWGIDWHPIDWVDDCIWWWDEGWQFCPFIIMLVEEVIPFEWEDVCPETDSLSIPLVMQSIWKGCWDSFPWFAFCIWWWIREDEAFNVTPPPAWLCCPPVTPVVSKRQRHQRLDWEWKREVIEKGQKDQGFIVISKPL